LQGTIKVTFGKYFYEKFSKPVREKKDEIDIIFDVIDILLLGDSDPIIRGTIVINIDKMSRLFCFLDNKYYSIVFPFNIENMDKNDNIHIYDGILDIDINSRIVALLKRIVSDIELESDTIEEIFEKVFFDVEDNEYTEKEIKDCFQLLLRIFSTDLGYIRYDYDEKHENEKIHPLHHLDINYSSKGTYKIGLKKALKDEDFIDMLDLRTECKYLN